MGWVKRGCQLGQIQWDKRILFQGKANMGWVSVVISLAFNDEPHSKLRGIEVYVFKILTVNVFTQSG